jgi:hypothetical protein
MTSADFLVYRNTESNPRPPQVIAFPSSDSCGIYYLLIGNMDVAKM